MRTSEKPTIGIVTQPTAEAGQYALYGSEYVAGGYVKWIEMAGVQAFYVPWHLPDSDIDALLRKANGLLFPGGPQQNTLPPSRYFQRIKVIYDKVVAWNNAGNFFPLIGICQGFEELIWSATDFGPELCVPPQGSPDACVNDTDNVLLPCDLTTYGQGSRILNSSGIAALDYFVKSQLATPITPNFHSNAVFPNAFRTNPVLNRDFEVVSTSQKGSGPVFVSMIEGKTLPIWGLQWHTSLQVFEWEKVHLSCLTHTPESVWVMQYLANFVASQLRRNPNAYPSGEFAAVKFSSQKQSYTENLTGGPVFENAYFFGPPVQGGIFQRLRWHLGWL